MKTMLFCKKLVPLLVLTLFFAACSDDDALDISFEYEDYMDRVYLWNTSDVGEQAAVSWSSDKELEFKKGSDNKYYFMLPDDDIGGSARITLKIEAGKSSGSVTRTVPVAKLETHRKYGLGNNLSEERANDVAYEWYVDQDNTGGYAKINCGPSVTEMAGRWVRQDFPMTAAQMRADSKVTGNWQVSNINNFLELNDINKQTISFTSLDNLKPYLDAGKIAILCIDLYYIRTESSSGSSEWRKDKFYTTSSASTGHFIIVKGYKKVDGEYLMECYDPWSLGRTYLDGQYKGKDRYYRASDILQAANVWWKYAIIVSPGPQSRTGTSGWDGMGLDPDTVPDQWG